MMLGEYSQWLYGFLGGILIGISALLLLLGQGKIAGISGIVGRLFSAPWSGQNHWRWLFVVGLLAGAGVVQWFTGELEITPVAEGAGLVLAAVLVGVGTRLGAGCTSGHGVCGIGRRSPRSIVATLIFMAVAMLTVTLVGGVL